MTEAESAIVSGIIQAITIVAGMSVMLAWLWNHGPGAKIDILEKRMDESMTRMERLVQDIRADHQGIRDRTQRLEILVEHVETEKHGRVRYQEEPTV